MSKSKNVAISVVFLEEMEKGILLETIIPKNLFNYDKINWSKTKKRPVKLDFHYFHGKLYLL